MKFCDYLRDKQFVYVIYGLAWGFILLFLAAFRVSLQVIVIVSVILVMAVVLSQLWDFFRKRSYYEKLSYCLGELDKKYLLWEMLDEANFLEGEILYHSLQEAGKSMSEQISGYRRENTRFREYIETWVHEIKLPVASLQLMCHNDGNEKYNENLRWIDEYIENVLYYARSENVQKDYVIREVSLKRVFADVAIKNREALLGHNIEVSTKGLDGKVMTDGKWLEYIIGQLMGNSMKYSSDHRKREIKVYAEKFDDKTQIHFWDNGIGIPQSDLPYVFEKSFTGENGRKRAKSTGMGLYIVKRLCDKLGHSIFIDSVQGEYTDIVISFGKNDLYKL